MQPVKFKGQNCTFAENQPEYLPLPAHKDAEGIVTSCWGLSLKERFRVLVRGKIFVQSMTFNSTLQPLNLKTVFEVK